MLSLHLCLQEEIYSSSYAAAAYLESIGFDKKVGSSSNSCLHTVVSAVASCHQAASDNDQHSPHHEHAHCVDGRSLL